MADFSDPVQQPINTPPAGVNEGDTGKTILDGGLKDFMDRLGDGHLGYLYNYWNKNPCCKPQHTTPTLGNGDEEKNLLPQLYTMSFGLMDEAAKQMDALTSSAGGLTNLAGGLSSGIAGAWSDKAGQAASERFGDLQKAAGDYQDSVKKLAAAMHSTWDTTRKAVDTLSKFPSTDESPAVGGNGGSRFMGLYGTEDKWNVGDWSRYIDALNDKLNSVNPDTQTVTSEGRFGESRSGGRNYTPQELEQPGIGIIGTIHVHYSNDVINTMNDFNNNYDAVVRNFRAQIKATHDAVHNQMVTLQNTVKEQISNTDPFGKLSVGAPPPPPGGSHTGSGSNGNGGYTGGGGGGSTGTSAASFTPPPISPSTAGGAGAGGGATTGAGAMPTIPPISTPVGSTGTGTSAYPGGGTGLPGAGTGLPGANPETLTVQSGGNTIGMSTPDSQNNVQLTVTDSSGHEHSYDIGFGQGTAMGGAGPTGGEPSQLAIQHITPGQDGHAVIHDGNLTITAAEPQGHNGPVQVTVDDGSGHPSTYTLGGGQAGGAGGYGTGVSGSGAPPSTVGAAMGGSGGYLAPTSGATSASGWLSPDAVNHAQTTATHDVGGTVAGHVGDMSGLTGAGGGGGHIGGGGGHPGLAVSGIGGGGAIHSVLGGSVDHTAGEVSGVGDVGLANTNVSHAGAAGGAGLATGPGGGGGQSGGMPMMGGMGGMGGGGQGQDTERGASQWRTQGHLFDNIADDSPASGFSGVLGEEIDGTTAR